MSAVMCFLFAGCSNETAQSSDGQASTDSVSSAAAEIPKPDGFKVDGTKLIDGYGEEFVMRGVNHAYTWFKSDTDTAPSCISSTAIRFFFLHFLIRLLSSALETLSH